MDLLIGADLTDAFVDIHLISGSIGQPIAKRNCFGCYVRSQFTDREEKSSAVISVDENCYSLSITE